MMFCFVSSFFCIVDFAFWYLKHFIWNCPQEIATEPVDEMSTLVQVMAWCHQAASNWVRSRNCGCLVTWFCYQLIAKPGNKTATVPWPDPITLTNVDSDLRRYMASLGHNELKSAYPVRSNRIDQCSTHNRTHGFIWCIFHFHQIMKLKLVSFPSMHAVSVRIDKNT